MFTADLWGVDVCCFNGKPMLRYYGYLRLLADWIEIPNLSGRIHKLS